MSDVKVGLGRRAWWILAACCWAGAGTFATAQPVNDAFASAEVIAGVAGSTGGTTENATSEAGEPRHANLAGGASVWYRWTCPSDGLFTFRTVTANPFSPDTVLAVYTGPAVDALTEIASNDDSPGLGFQSLVTFNATAGEDYLIAVDGFGAFGNPSTGLFGLTWFEGAPPPPPVAGIAGEFNFSSSFYFATENETLQAGFNNPVQPGTITSGRNRSVRGAIITVTRTGGSAGRVLVDCATVNTNTALCTETNYTNFTTVAIPDCHYTPTSVTLLFDEFQMSRSFVIPVRSDGRATFNRTVDIILSNARPAAEEEFQNPGVIAPILGTRTNATLNIIEFNNGILRVQDTNVTILRTNFNIERRRYAADEGAGSITVDVILTGGSGSVNVNVVGSNARNNGRWNLLAGSDFAHPADVLFPNPPYTDGNTNFQHAADFTAFSTTLNFAANQNRLSVDIPILNDSVKEFNEDILVYLTFAGANNPPIGPNDRAFITILDDEQTAGALDRDWNPDSVGFTTPRFNSAPGANGTVRAVAVQADQRTVIGGDFTAYNSFPRNRIARINPDGSHDPSFGQNTGADSYVSSLAVYPTIGSSNDGKIVAGGGFTSFNNTDRRRIARLNSDGSLDATFLPGLGANGPVRSVALQSDGKVLIAGDFTEFNGVVRNRIARLHVNGSLDTAFNPGLGADDTVWSVAVRDGSQSIFVPRSAEGSELEDVNEIETGSPQGNLVIDYDFINIEDNIRVYYDGVRIFDLTTNGIGQLSVNYGPGASTKVTVILNQGTGLIGTLWRYTANIFVPTVERKIFIGGEFLEVDGQVRSGVARLNDNGSVDPSFDPGGGAAGAVYVVAPQTDGRLLIGGSFSSVDFRTRSRLARLSLDGSLDTSYDPGSGANDSVYTIALQRDGKAMVGGLFTSFNQTRRMGLTRLFVNGAVDTSFLDTAYNQFAGVINPFNFQTPSFVNSVALQADGAVMIGGAFSSVGGHWVSGQLNVLQPFLFGTSSTVFTRSDKRPRMNVARLIGGYTPGPGNMEFVFPQNSIDENAGTLSVAGRRIDGYLGTVQVTAGTTNGVAGTNDFVSTFGAMLWNESAFANRPISFGSVAERFFSIPILDDQLIEGDELFHLGLISPRGSITLGGETIPLGAALGVPTARASITDNDRSKGSFTFSAPAYSFVETSAVARITVVRTNGSSDPVSVRYFTTNGTALAGTGLDYTAVTDTLTFDSGETVRSFDVPLNNDLSVENDETFTVTLFNPTGGATILPGGTATSTVSSVVMIIDNDRLSGKANFASPTFATNEGSGLARVTLVRLGGSVGQLTVNVSATDGALAPASEGIDYTPVTNTVTWVHNDTLPKSFLVPLTDDPTVEGDETVALQLFGPSPPGATGAVNTATLTIVDDDFPGSFSFSQAIYDVDERGTNVTITVVRSGGIGGSVDVDYSVADDTAVNGTDFVAGSGTLTFAPGMTATNFSIAVIDNTLTDSNRTATLNLNVNAPGSAGALVSATLRIIDDELIGDPAGTLDSSFNRLAGANDAVNAIALQPDGGILVAGAFRAMNRVTRNRVARLDANGLLDGTFNVGQGPNQPVRAMALQPDGRIVIGGLFDRVHSTNRNYIARLLPDGSLDLLFNPGAGADNPVFAVSLLADGGIVIGGSFSSVNGISRPGIAVLNPDGTVRESFNPGVGANGVVLAIKVQNDGKILIGGEFSTVQGVNTPSIARLHPDGSIDSTFDTGLAPNGAVRAIAVQADGKILIGGSFSTVDGAARGRLARLLSDGSLDPFYQAALDGANGDVLSIALQFDGRALIGGEFTQFNSVTRGRITRLLPNGKTDPTINFGSGANDTISAIAIQPDRRFLIGGRFTEYSGESRRYLARIHGGSIAGNGTLQFSAAFYEIAEAALQMTVVVERHGGTAGDVAVDYASMAGSASAGVDYTDVAAALTFVEGEVRQSFTITVVNDSIGELPEDVILFLSNPTGDATLGDVPVALLTILSDDSQIGFNSASYSVIENVVGGNVLVTVVRTGATDGGVQVNYATTAGSASVGADYTPASGVLTFAPGQTTQTFNVAISDDALIEPTESFGLVLLNAVGSATIGLGTSTVSIVDNDFRSGNLTFSAVAYSVSEGAGPMVITVLRTNGTTGVLTVGYATSGGTAVADVDYDSASGTLTFIEGQTSATILVPIINDTEVEGDEGFEVRLFNPTGGTIISSATNAVVTIQDDEFGPGSLDRTFDPGSGANGLVRSIAVQADGRVIAGGAFTLFDGQSRNSVTRLHANGALDLGFDPGLGANGGVSAVGATPVGNILLAGTFDRVDGQPFNRVARLETNGLPDASFSASSGVNAGVDALTVLADGRFFIGGAFSSPTRGISRLTAGGNVDPSFGPGSGTDGRVHCAVVQPDGSVIIGGTFATVTGEARSRVARLDSSGLLDTAFATAVITNGTVLCAALQADGRILVGGDFVVAGSTNRVRIARLNTDGTLDASFNPGLGANGAVYGIGIQSSGRIILGGDFTSINGTSRGRFARLLSNGSLDLSFDPGRGANATVYSVIILANDDVLLGGAFSQISGTPRGGVARILGGGGVGPAFAGASVQDGIARFSISVRPGWDYVLEASADLVHWNPVTTYQATSTVWQFSEPVAPGAKFFRVRQLAQ